jgi:hypothetical protein
MVDINIVLQQKSSVKSDPYTLFIVPPCFKLSILFWVILIKKNIVTSVNLIPARGHLSHLAATIDDLIVVLLSQYIDLDRDRGSSNSILFVLSYILCVVRRCARLLCNII